MIFFVFAVDLERSRDGTMMCICKIWGLEIVSSLDVYATFSLLERFFEHQELFDNKQTVPMLRFEVVEKFVKLGTATSENSYQHFLRSGFNDTKPYWATRVSFKYIVTRSVWRTDKCS